MARKKEEEVKKGLDEWMGTFSDMMTLLMCFFVMLFSMSTIDAAKFEEASKSFQQTISIFKAGSSAIGDGILVSNGVSQLNQLDEFFNTSGKTAESDTDEIEFEETAQAKQDIAESIGMTKEELAALLEALGMTEEELEKLMSDMADRMSEADAQDMQEIAESVGMTQEQLAALLEALGMTEEELEKLMSDIADKMAEASAQGAQEVAEQMGLTAEQLAALLDETGMTKDDLEKVLDGLEEEKMQQSEQMAEKIEEALAEGMMQDKVNVEFNGDCVILSLSGAFLFDSGQATLKEQAIPVLDKVGVILTKYAENTIEIEGHTDSVPLNGGRYENNDVLSSYRALAVFDYLEANTSIDPGVMKHSGRGEYIPVADNSTPEGRAKNRRVEIKIYNTLSAY